MSLLTLLRSKSLSVVATSLPRRSFMMSSARERSEKVLEELKEANPYFSKYAEKIAKLQQTSPEDFLQRLEVADKQKKKPKFGFGEKSRNYSEILSPKPALDGSSSQADETHKLSDILKVQLLEDKTADEIKHIWLEYHKTKDVVSAVINVKQFEELQQQGKEFPIFIFPLPRDQGYEFIMHQFHGNAVHFTPLLSYQVHKENAPECLNIVHYTDFKDKGIVLMRGEFDVNIISAREAQYLVNQLQMYYCQRDEARLALLRTFTKEPEKFKHMDVIKQIEEIKLE